MTPSLLLALQLTVAGSVTATAAASDGFYRDREVLGARYHAHLTGPLHLQAGGILAAENGLFPSKSGAGTRHWAVGLALAPWPWVQVGPIGGRLVEQRTDERPHEGLRDIAYYGFVAAGFEIRAGPAGLTVERLLWVPQQAGLGLHQWRLAARVPGLSCSASRVVQSDDQAPYAFWAPQCALRPFRILGGPRLLRPLVIEGGRRAVLSYRTDRSAALDYLSVGVAFP